MDNLPKGWKFYRLHEIAKFIDYRGYTPNKTDSGVPLITAKNVRIGFLNVEPREYISDKEYSIRMTRGFPQKGDVLFTTEAPLGYVAIFDLDYKVAIGQRLITLQRKDSTYDSKFLLYSILSGRFQKELYEKATGTTVKGIKASILKQIQIPLPPLSEQTRIVAKLDALFARIDKSIALLEENIKHTKALMASVLEEVYSNSLKISKLSSLDKVCIKITDGSHFSPKSHDSGYPYITVKDIDNKGFIDFDNSKRISVESYQDLLKSGCQPQKGDVLFSKDGTVGKVSVVDFQKEWVVLSSLAILRPNLKILLPEYLGIILKTPTFQNSAIGLKTGAAIKRIVLKTIKEIEIPLPGLKDQKIFYDYYKTVNFKIEKISSSQQSKLVYLKALKSSLLDRAFKGEL